MWNLKNAVRTYLQNRKRLIDIENNLTVTKGKRTVGINWEFGINRYLVLYIINNKDRIYRIRNYICYLIITHNGKESKKYIYVYITESLCCTPKLTIFNLKNEVGFANVILINTDTNFKKDN